MTSDGSALMVALSPLEAPYEGQVALFEFVLGLGVIGVLFWVLYHLEKDWPERLLRDRGFREDALALVFGVALAWWLIPFFV